MAKEGKGLEQTKLLQPLLGTPEGIYMGFIIFFHKCIGGILIVFSEPSETRSLYKTVLINGSMAYKKEIIEGSSEKVCSLLQREAQR